MPDGSNQHDISCSVPDQQLSFLQIGRRVNPQRFALVYAIYRSIYWQERVILPDRLRQRRRPWQLFQVQPELHQPVYARPARGERLAVSPGRI